MTILRLVASLKNGFTILYAMGKIFGADKQDIETTEVNRCCQHSCQYYECYTGHIHK